MLVMPVCFIGMGSFLWLHSFRFGTCFVGRSEWNTTSAIRFYNVASNFSRNFLVLVRFLESNPVCVNRVPLLRRGYRTGRSNVRDTEAWSHSFWEESKRDRSNLYPNRSRTLETEHRPRVKGVDAILVGKSTIEPDTSRSISFAHPCSKTSTWKVCSLPTHPKAFSQSCSVVGMWFCCKSNHRNRTLRKS